MPHFGPSTLPDFLIPGSRFDHSRDVDQPRTAAPFLTGQRTAQATRETFLPEQKITAFEDLRSTLANPLGDTGIQSVIQSLLQALTGGEETARRNQADQFRRAGAISDASRGVASARLEGEIGRNRGSTAAQGLLQFLGPLLQGRSAALAGIPALSRAQQTSSTERFGFDPNTRSILARNRASASAAARAGGSAEQNNLEAALNAQVANQQLFPSTQNTVPSFSTQPGSGQQSALPGSPSATAFAPGGGQPFAGSGTASNPFRQDNLGQFEQFSQADQNFFFGR